MKICMDLIVKNCKVVSADGVYEACIGVEDGKIVKIGLSLEDRAEKTYDAKGNLLFPGVIDGHVHLNLRYDGDVYTADDFFTGTAAAACGGVTTIIDFITPQTKDYVEEFWKRRRDADGNVVVDYGLHISVTSVEPSTVKSLKRLFYEMGVCSVKVFTAYGRRGLMLDDGAIYSLMRLCSENNVLVMAHCENEHLINMLVEEFLSEGKTEPIYHALSRPDYVEAEAVQRVAYLSQLTDAETLVVHLSSKAGLKNIRRAGREGVRIHAETCPHYLVFTDEVYKTADGAKFIMSPPLKGKADREALWDGLGRGDISIVGSDHACFNSSDKLRPRRFVDVPGGVAGTEVIAMILYSEGVLKDRISLGRMVEVTARNPALLYGLYPRKGVIAVGSDADFYILNPRAKTKLNRENLHSNIDHSIYEGFEVDCRIESVFSRGELIAREGEVVATRGRGRYLSRSRNMVAGTHVKT
ncbi:MAG: dihydropyrimidinase [Candidatus Caldarchaeum sp.]